MDEQIGHKVNSVKQESSSNKQLNNILKLPKKESQILKNQSLENNGLQPSQSKKHINSLNGIECIQSLFCSKGTIQSLRKKTQAIQILEFESKPGKHGYSESQYNRIVEKKEKLNSKTEYQRGLLLKIKEQDGEKYNNILKLLFFMNQLKQQVGINSVEDYSQRTCNAIFQSENKNLVILYTFLTSIYKRIHSSIQIMNSQQQQRINKILKELTILPRFLISKEKIEKLVISDELQQNFTFLIINNCLGHYSNEANKKMPSEENIICLKKLFETNKNNIEYAKDMFKAICSINHGNKYQKDKGKDLYNHLYQLTLEDLKQLEKKTYQNIKMKKKFSKKQQFSPNKRKKITRKDQSDDSSGDGQQSQQSDNFVICPEQHEKMNNTYSPKRKWSQQKKIQIRKLFKPNEEIQYPSIPKIVEPIFIIEPRKTGNLDQRKQKDQP